MLLFVTLVLSSITSLRGAARAIEVVTALIPIPLPLLPCSWWAGRFWLLRLGLYKLTRPKAVAEDWVWIVDHSVQVGPEKCLLILGVRLSTLPAASCQLCHEDVEPIDLRPVRHSTGEIVWQQLEAAVEKTGVPREILSDHGSDLWAGIRRFCEAHPQTSAVYDVTHKAATLLKAVLTRDESWPRFCAFASQMKRQVQQTVLAPLAPPAQKTKARYMNVGQLGRWADRVLHVLEEDPSVAGASSLSTHPDRAKVTWIEDFRDGLEVWQELFTIVETTEHCVRQYGFQEECVQKMEERIGSRASTSPVSQFREAMVAFVRTESAKARPGERLLGSSEIIESVFGKVKHIEGPQAKQGFTGLILSAAAMVAPTNAQVLWKAMETVSTASAQDWCREVLGESVQAQRTKLFAQTHSSGTKPGET